MAQAGVQRAAEGSLSLSELRTLSLDLLRRPPFDAERRKFVRDLARHAGPDDPGHPGREPAGPVDRTGKAGELLALPEFWNQWYEEQLYYFLLVDNFAPRGESMLAIPAELAAGTLNVRDAIHRIALSSSFDQRNPGADTFVTVVMEQLAGLAVEKHRRELEIGKAVYDGKTGNFLGRAGSSQSDVVRTAIELRSFAEAFLAREHRRYVHAAPGKLELKAWTDAFAADPRVFAELLRGWLASPAYRARLARREPLDNRLYVRALLVDVCRREPTPEEFSRMRSALDGLADPTPLRAVMARLLLDSEGSDVPRTKDGLDLPKFVRESFERLLGRVPTADEELALVASLEDPAARPALLVYALITHPEYQSY